VPRQQVAAEEAAVDEDVVGEGNSAAPLPLSSPLVGEHFGEMAEGMRGSFDPRGDVGGEVCGGRFDDDVASGFFAPEGDGSEPVAPMTLAPGGRPPEWVTSLAFMMTF
jgi:hypothetical protein